jgi:hypothetical protein
VPTTKEVTIKNHKFLKKLKDKNNVNHKSFTATAYSYKNLEITITAEIILCKKKKIENIQQKKNRDLANTVLINHKI